MKKYLVTMIQTEMFDVEIEAEDAEIAEELAITQFNQGNYKETGNLNVSVDDVKEV